MSNKPHFSIAGVCVFGRLFSEEGIYDYTIPSELDEEIVPGRFVTVPFGVQNRPCTGVVLELRDTSPYQRLKAIRSVYPELISLDEEQRMLCDYLCSKVLSDTESAVRAMMPVAAFSHLSEYVSLTGEPLPSARKPSELETGLFDYLREHNEVSVPALRSRYGSRVEATLRKFAAKGIIQRRFELREAREGVLERAWQLNVDLETANILAGGGERDGIRLTSHPQTRVLAAMAEEEAPMRTSELTRRANVTAGVLKTLEKAGVVSRIESRTSRNPYTEIPYTGRTPLTLNEEQSDASRKLFDLMDTGKPKAALLYGVTGSGKTRVLTALMDRILDAGKTVIMLLPEISLTPQSVSIFCSRYGNRVAVMHSGLSSAERYDAYCRIRRGEVRVVIGTRSAVFAPVQNLGAIIIDEEQEHTYKSDQTPRYHAREIARRRCAYHKAMMVLASATPSVETMMRARQGIYTEIRLTKRYGSATLPDTEIVDLREDLREGNRVIGTRLANALSETLSRGEQAILFLNRRGYNRTVTCRTCGKPLVCPNCSVAMTFHTYPWNRSDGQLRCHWCGTTLPLPKTCPECGGEHLAHIGFGTQMVEEELSSRFPKARILRMDADTTTTKTAYDSMLGTFRQHGADILLGTQMVTKGHDFPDVTLVGVLQADMSLYVDDYRASEQTFSLLTQVIGRAGRRDRKGLAIIQTMNPYHDIIRLACRQDYESFYNREIQTRKLLTFPPFCDMAVIHISSESEPVLLDCAKRIVKELPVLREKLMPDEPLMAYGPFEAPVYRVDKKYRMRVILKCRITDNLIRFVSALMKTAAESGKTVSVSSDFNPTEL